MNCLKCNIDLEKRARYIKDGNLYCWKCYIFNPKNERAIKYKEKKRLLKGVQKRDCLICGEDISNTDCLRKYCWKCSYSRDRNGHKKLSTVKD